MPIILFYPRHKKCTGALVLRLDHCLDLGFGQHRGLAYRVRHAVVSQHRSKLPMAAGVSPGLSVFEI